MGGSTAGLSGTSPYEALSDELEVPLVPALTLQCHPELGRLGERALLGSLVTGGARRVNLSRLEPLFFTPGASSGRPLEDPYISRKPLVLEAQRDGSVLLDPGLSKTRVQIEGEPLAGPRPCSPEELLRGVVLELSGRVTLLLHYHLEVPEPEAESFGLIGDNPVIRRLRNEIRRVADLKTPVLIRGATGTGKELVARALHDVGPWAREPFVGVNLGALPPALAAAELFGATRGAFTGATRDQPGYFRKAQGGTLFLDEIGEAPPEVQVLLLRVLETGEVQPLGAQVTRPVGARILAATDADLEAQAEDGAFRSPLLHRLSGYVLWLPPLGQRRDDFGRLLLHFLRQELHEIGEGARLSHPADAPAPWLPARLVGRLLRYGWPGNVRQLRNVVRQLVIANRGRSRLRRVPAVEQLLTGEEHPGAQERPSGSRRDSRQQRKPAEIGPEELEEALEAQDWELAAAARALGISRPSIYNLIEAHPRLRLAGDLSAEEIRQSHETYRGDLEAMGKALKVSVSALKRRVRELGMG